MRSSLTLYQEEDLLGENQSVDNSAETNAALNRALRCILAHLHRYKSELKLLEETIGDVCKYRNQFNKHFLESSFMNKDNKFDTDCNPMSQLSSHIVSIARFRDELQAKADNVLALVSTLTL